MTAKETELIVSIINSVLEEKGYDVSTDGVGFCEDQPEVIRAADCGSLEDHLEWILKDVLAERTVPEGTAKEVKAAWAAYDAAQKRLESESKYCLTKEMRRILGKDSGTISLNRESFEQELYDCGITLYDKHGFCETGLPLEIVLDDENGIKVICQGIESDDEETLDFTDLTSWSQEDLAILFSEIDEKEYFFLRDGEDVTVCSDIEDEELADWFNELEDSELIKMFDFDHTDMEEFRNTCRKEFQGWDSNRRKTFFYTNI